MVPTSRRTTRSSRASCRSGNGSTRPYEDIIDRTKGKFDYGIPGKVVENSPHIMKYWMDHASYPFQSHDLWFITEDIRWGKFEPTVDAKGLIKKVNREDIWREVGQDARRQGVGHSGLDLARQGDLLRRQGVRSGKPGGLPQEPRDQARGNRMNSGPPHGRPDSSSLEQI